ncbi:pyridoxal phosphate-dependent aminotransferase [Trinickia acidisoli]|uniref:pyridoxal phosphate-dependent aminotransferase n=1 Tax=Trinickia acidisoli TaxID=2767482 RepID=UPI001A8D18E7|nr:pyridoxal phosphate-dependent aminotransferase [Trinickia acidisoli]
MTQSHTHSIQTRTSIHELAGSLIREVANSGMGKADVLPFWFGESDLATAGFIRDEAARSLANGETFYSQNLGRPYLREGIASYLTSLHNQHVETDRIAVVSSGVTGLMITAELLLAPRDRVVAITPLWPNVCEIPKILSAEVERVPLCVREGRWTLDLDRLLGALTPNTKALIVNSPNNPTGWVIDEQSVAAILQHCRQHGIWIVCDDVYERLVYDPDLRSAPSFLKYYKEGDRIISVNSFSKAWSMTGWRAGWMVVPQELTADLAKVIEYNFSCVFEPVQRAASVALLHGEPEVARLKRRLADTRALLKDALVSLPDVEVPDAGGAMYMFFRIAGRDDSLALAKQLVSEVGLGLAPGSAFGAEGNGWLRWCHAVSADAKLLDGVDRLRTFLSQSKG